MRETTEWRDVPGGKVNRRGGFIGDVVCAVCGKRFGQHYGLDCDARDPSRIFTAPDCDRALSRDEAPR